MEEAGGRETQLALVFSVSYWVFFLCVWDVAMLTRMLLFTKQPWQTGVFDER